MLMVLATAVVAQVPDPDVPLTTFKVNVVAKTAKAVNYRHRSGATKIDFAGTAALAEAKGQAKVESKQGYIEIEVEFANLAPATRFRAGVFDLRAVGGYARGAGDEPGRGVAERNAQ